MIFISVILEMQMLKCLDPLDSNKLLRGTLNKGHVEY